MIHYAGRETGPPQILRPSGPVQRAVIAREARSLEAKLGEAYRGDKARVRRWI